MITGLYLHIPFCHARCGYCDFVTFTGQESRIDRYVTQLNRELALHRQQPWGQAALSTVFFGGGTPSLLEPGQIASLLETLRVQWELAPEAEITLEANPESVTEAKARGWREAGVNRLSLGLQSFDDALLRQMGRLHSAEGFRTAYGAARAAGFDNVSLDLIYGLPGQSLEGWQETARQAAALAPEHISAYALSVEEHTPYASLGYSLDSDLQAAMYEWARTYWRTQGYEQYEISNFARPRRACRHNLIYWRQQDYLGVGVGAVGCIEGLRWQNTKSLDEYKRALDGDRLPWASQERLDAPVRRFERLMLGLRLREGLDWGPEDNAGWLAQRERLTRAGLLEEIQPGRWRIPDHAVALSNQVILPFL